LQAPKKAVAFLKQLERMRKHARRRNVKEALEILAGAAGNAFPSDDADLWRSFRSLQDFAARFDHDPTRFFSNLALGSDGDLYAERAEKVSLMTLHAAKGLEFPVVFITGCENDLIPFERFQRRPSDPEEERRLFYVGITRARERLFLTWAAKRKIFGRTAQRHLSPFVEDIDGRLLEIRRPAEPGGRKPRQLRIFEGVSARKVAGAKP
jgi:superfamily I DNA/RNA helicase